MKKALRQIWMFAFLVIAASGIAAFASYAVEQSELQANTVYQLSEDTTVYESADESSNVVTQMVAGTAVIVGEYDGGDWCQITSADIVGYVQIAKLEKVGDADALASEFSNIQNDYENTYTEVLELQKQRRNSRIWGAIIIVLVVALFAVGIVSAVRENGKEKNDNADENDIPEENIDNNDVDETDSINTEQVAPADEERQEENNEADNTDPML